MESYYMWVGALLVLALTLKYAPDYIIPSPSSITNPGSKSESKSLISSQTSSKTSTNEQQNDQKMKEFNQFQTWYIIIFLFVMLADWMQGPYVYKLYSSYGIPTQQIAVLFIIGFGTSGVCGAFIGSLADKFGRKNMCILFCIFYILCCLTKHFDSYKILICGRFLGGISTSILFSCFESWMVTHHHKMGFPGSKMGDTFEKAWSLNSFVAILAGVITSYAVRLYSEYKLFEGKPSEIAAFDCSAIVLVMACIMITSKWKRENYGDSSLNMRSSLQNAMELFKSDRRIIFVGVIQSGFESAMYLFVFMWTMALEQARGENESIDHGMIFAVFMESCLVGTTLSGILSKRLMWKSEKISIFLCFVAAISLFCIPFTQNYEFRLFLFVVFECCVGAYFPVIGALRSKYVPDNVRATIMNIFRIPLNVIVVVVLWFIDELGLKKVFILASVLLIIASLSSYFLGVMTAKKQSAETTPVQRGG